MKPLMLPALSSSADLNQLAEMFGKVSKMPAIDATLNMTTPPAQLWTVKDERYFFIGAFYHRGDWLNLMKGFTDDELVVGLSVDTWFPIHLPPSSYVSETSKISIDMEKKALVSELRQIDFMIDPDSDYYVMYTRGVILKMPKANAITMFVLANSFGVTEKLKPLYVFWS